MKSLLTAAPMVFLRSTIAGPGPCWRLVALSGHPVRGCCGVFQKLRKGFIPWFSVDVGSGCQIGKNFASRSVSAREVIGLAM
jgi:hypothetical protein